MKVVTVLLLFAVLITPLGVMSVSAQDTIPLACGETIQSETTPQNPTANYQLQVAAGTVIEVRIEPLGSTLRVAGVFVDSGGVEFLALNENGVGIGESISELMIATSNPTLLVGGTVREAVTYEFSWFYFERDPAYGAFTVYLGCEGVSSAPAPQPRPRPDPFPGFPGVDPVDFSGGIEIPLILGLGQIAPIANDVALYTYTASAGEVATLNVTRVSGDISIGVTVINKDTNDIIFVGGMPSSDTLSVALTFPSDGTYAIGLFRFDTATVSGTSGAVQVTLQ